MMSEVTLHLPQPNASGNLDPTTNTLKASGQDDLVDLFLDLDNIVATSAGVPGLFGSELDFGPFSAGFDIINVEMGPTIDLKQDFELEPTLWVELIFDQAVQIGGNLVTKWRSAWDLLPDITFLSNVTKVSPTFFLDADLSNITTLDFDLEFFIDLLQITYGVDLLDIENTIGIGNVLDQAIDLFTSPALYNNLDFELQGFNIQIGESFEIALGSQSTVPPVLAARSAINPTSVPEPSIILLLLIGLLVLYAKHWQARRDDPVFISGSSRRFSATGFSAFYKPALRQTCLDDVASPSNQQIISPRHEGT